MPKALRQISENTPVHSVKLKYQCQNQKQIQAPLFQHICKNINNETSYTCTCASDLHLLCMYKFILGMYKFLDELTVPSPCLRPVWRLAITRNHMGPLLSHYAVTGAVLLELLSWGLLEVLLASSLPFTRVGLDMSVQSRCPIGRGGRGCS